MARAPASRTRAVVVRADASKPEINKLADSVGMPSQLGFFGFNPFAEMWVGRWAMLGFASSIVGELTSGGGALSQLHLMTPAEPSYTLLATIAALAGGASIIGSGVTATKLWKKEMPRGQVDLYKSFLGLTNDKDWQVAEKQMKAKPDVTSLGVDTAAIDAVRVEGMPADRVLSMTGDLTAADQAAAAMKAAEQVSTSGASRPAASPAPTSSPEQRRGDANSLLLDDMGFARTIEQTNGRWAMMGFLASLIGEAATGYGILGQVVLWCKLVGLLGADSGF